MARKDGIEAMAKFCVHLRSIFQYYEILFEEGQLRRTLLHRTAPVFFGDLKQLLMEQLVLQICRLKDPLLTIERTNPMIDYAIREADFSGAPEARVRVSALRNRIHQIRSKDLPACNRLIGHLYLNVAMAGQPLGPASDVEWVRFLARLGAVPALGLCPLCRPGWQLHAERRWYGFRRGFPRDGA